MLAVSLKLSLFLLQVRAMPAPDSTHDLLQ